ncbi:hypothetical protein TELCIR_03194 [Teladorsagia circumcincta]|uniref:Uncharacterized protein n=1 Tax=Teladorsagia circumcincta TaxID=45464 RepID=A0A2G9UWZ9_TELCI|nr:hypothetical protein TELCIR_03194 [Teladorsagia circumcincta]
MTPKTYFPHQVLNHLVKMQVKDCCEMGACDFTTNTFYNFYAGYEVHQCRAMWPLRVFCFCVLLLVSAHAFEGYKPQLAYYRQSEPEVYLEENRPILKRQVFEVKRKEALARARCFFNPITC